MRGDVFRVQRKCRLERRARAFRIAGCAEQADVTGQRARCRTVPVVCIGILRQPGDRAFQVVVRVVEAVVAERNAAQQQRLAGIGRVAARSWSPASNASVPGLAWSRPAASISTRNTMT